jgi:cysteinyl-tRNA synthetase
VSEQLTVYNTLGREEQSFEPQSGNTVNMYVCGVTVYDDCHVGHGRAYVTFDVIRRFLEHEGFDVNYVENFTDVEDKIIDRAEEEGKSWEQVAEENIEAYTEVMSRLNIRHADETDDPEKSPRVSGCIPEIIEHVEGLIDNGSAYEVEGDVFFDIESFPEYGKLSGQDKDEMQSGSRVDVDERKQSPLDFALWKSVSSEEEQQGAPAWDSPWGRGRPGWHIECSVMAQSRLGDTLDIHGGGQDLIFPHHENEIAQSEGLTGEPFANYWIHNGFVTIDDEKMSKSEGNFYTLKELMDGVEMDGETVAFDPMTIRYFILTRHYRSPIDFSFDRLKEAEKSLGRIREGVKRLRRAMNGDDVTDDADGEAPSLDTARSEFLSAMREDFNTADALGQVQTLIRDWNTLLSEQGEQLTADQKAVAFEHVRFLEEALETILGIPLQTGNGDSGEDESVDSDVREMLEERENARENGDYEEADRLRDEIQSRGYRVIDTPQGTELEPIDE